MINIYQSSQDLVKERENGKEKEICKVVNFDDSLLMGLLLMESNKLHETC